ncbi:hypothetical protein Scep_016405 [Stephania cephalantha]|uniref:Uncharacterized protein n=1 Tax=Stephania cephalantha TaxID=152367 RepID=A0AAP0NSK7_9MAGN
MEHFNGFVAVDISLTYLSFLISSLFPLLSKTLILHRRPSAPTSYFSRSDPVSLATPPSPYPYHWLDLKPPFRPSSSLFSFVTSPLCSLASLSISTATYLGLPLHLSLDQIHYCLVAYPDPPPPLSIPRSKTALASRHHRTGHAITTTPLFLSNHELGFYHFLFFVDLMFAILDLLF